MPPPDTESLRAAFAGPAELTVGIEEELMLLDPRSLGLAPVAREALSRLGVDRRFKGELPAAQIELITTPARTVGEAAGMLRSARADLASATEGLARPAGSGTHPFAAATGELSADARYEFTRARYGPVAARQLVFGLHVHVRVAEAERALAVYNALRSFLPELAALGANAPFHEGADSGLASVRPLISGLLPRQGVPPALADLGELAAAFRFGARSGTFPEPGMWWWELRLHPVLGTVELRVPDQQTTVAESVAIAALAHALVAWLAERHDGGEALPVHPSWRIAENRWTAAREGLGGSLADLETGEPRPARERLARLIDSVVPVAERIGCAGELEGARALAAHGGAERQREAAGGGAERQREAAGGGAERQREAARGGAERQREAGGGGGPAAVAAWLAERFLAP